MFTCRTCKLLKHSEAKKSVVVKDGELVQFSCEASCVMDALAEWYCPYFWWSSNHPERGQGCVHWQNMNGKHWI